MNKSTSLVTLLLLQACGPPQGGGARGPTAARSPRPPAQAAAPTPGAAEVPPQVAALIKQLDTKDIDQQRAAAEALGKLGPKAAAAAPALIAAMGGAKPTGKDVSWKLPDEGGGEITVTLPASRYADHSLWIARTALGKLGPGAMPPLIAALSNRQWWVRRAAVNALARIGEDKQGRATLPLMKLLNDRHRRVAREATRALRAVKLEPRHLPVLLKALQNKGCHVHGRVVMLMRAVGPAAVPVMVDQLGRAAPRVRVILAEVLLRTKGGAGHAAAVVTLIKLARDKSFAEREQVVALLGHLGTRALPALPLLTELLRDPGWRIRWKAAYALGKIGPEASPAAPGLVRALKDTKPRVRHAAATALGGIIAGDVAVSPLIAALGHADAQTRQRAAAALGAHGVKARVAVKPLIRALKDSVARVREVAAAALGQVAGPRPGRGVVTALVKALRDKEQQVRYEALAALIAFKPLPRHAVKALALGLVDEKARTRLMAQGVAIKLGARAAALTSALIASLRFEYRYVNKAKQANRALEDLLFSLGRRGIPRLIRGLSHKDERVRIRVATVLGRFGPRANRALPRLHAMLLKGEFWERYWSAKAMGEIGPGAIPRLKRTAVNAKVPLRERSFAMGAMGRAARQDTKLLPFVVRLLDRCRARVAKCKQAGARSKRGGLASAMVGDKPCSLSCHWWEEGFAAAMAGWGALAVPALLKQLDSRHEFWRYQALHCLHLLGPKAAAARPKLWALTTHTDDYVAQGAVKALTRIGITEPDLPRLLKLIQTQNEDSLVTQMTRWAIASLGPKALRYLAAQYAHKDPRVRMAAVRALGGFRKPRHRAAAMKVATKALHDPHPGVKFEAVAVVGSMELEGAAQVADRLVAMLAGADKKLSDKLIDVLSSCCKEAQGPLLVLLAKGAERNRVAALHGLTRCHRSLRNIGHQAAPAVPWLTRLLSGGNCQLATFAAIVLGKVGSAARAAVPALDKAYRSGCLTKDAWQRTRAKRAFRHAIKLIDRQAFDQLNQRGQEACPKKPATNKP